MKLINNQSTKLVTELSKQMIKGIEWSIATLCTIIPEVHKLSKFLIIEENEKVEVANEEFQLLEEKYC